MFHPKGAREPECVVTTSTFILTTASESVSTSGAKDKLGLKEGTV